MFFSIKYKENEEKYIKLFGNIKEKCYFCSRVEIFASPVLKQTSEMAKDAGVYDQVMASQLELAKSHLNHAVADGKMSQEQADKIFQDIKDGKHFGPKDGMHKHMMQGPRDASCQNDD